MTTKAKHLMPDVANGSREKGGEVITYRENGNANHGGLKSKTAAIDKERKFRALFNL